MPFEFQLKVFSFVSVYVTSGRNDVPCHEVMTLLLSLPVELWESHILVHAGPLQLAHHVGACIQYVAAVRIQRCWKHRIPWISWAKRNLEVYVCTHSSKGWRRGCISDMHLPNFPMLQVYDPTVPGGAYHFFVTPGSSCWVIPRK